jgi:hypothetical protein
MPRPFLPSERRSSHDAEISIAGTSRANAANGRRSQVPMRATPPPMSGKLASPRTRERCSDVGFLSLIEAERLTP